MRPPGEFDLTKLLGAIDRETFFRDSWEKQPLAVQRHDPAYYEGLFSLRDVDSVIAFTRPTFLQPEAFKPGGPPRYNFVQGWLPDDEPFAGYYPDLPDVHRAFALGKTLIIKAMQRRWPTIAAMCRNLERFFGCDVHTNLYLTPPGAQGFAAHYDTHEVFVLQIDGEKHWRFYGAGPGPAPGQRHGHGVEGRTGPADAGGVLATGRSAVHAARPRSRSLHLGALFAASDRGGQGLSLAGPVAASPRRRRGRGRAVPPVAATGLAQYRHFPSRFQADVPRSAQELCSGRPPGRCGRGHDRGLRRQAGRAAPGLLRRR